MESRTPTLKTIAENLGLSLGTVPRALHGKGGYSPQTQRLILAEAKRVGYSANTAASALRRPPITLGVLLPEPTGRNQYFFNYLWQGIDKACHDLSIYQIRLVKRCAEPGSDAFIASLEQLLTNEETPIEGLITVSRRDMRFDSLMERFAERKIPVFIVNSITKSPNCFSIDSNRSIGKLGADIFASIHRHSTGNVLLLGGSRDNLMQAERTADFCQKIMAECPGLDILETHNYHDLPKLKSFIIECAHKFDNIVGIYAVSARETLTMCEALEEIHLGGRLTAIGTDTFPQLLPYFQNNTLTASVCQYPAKQTYMAVQILIAQITKTPVQLETNHFPIAAVFKSNAEAFCMLEGLI